MVYFDFAFVIALVMVPVFFLPFAAKSWRMLVLIAGITALVCAVSVVYFLPGVTRPWSSFLLGMFAALAGVSVGFGAIVRGFILFLRGGKAQVDMWPITVAAIGVMLVGTYAVLWKLG